MRISTVILTFNSAAVIAATLDSVLKVSHEVFVVDSFSTDDTVGIAEKRGARVVQHRFENYGAQRNWAIANLPIVGDWELHLDADERLSLELASEIERLQRQAQGAGIDGYFIPRLVEFLGRPIRHGGMYPIWHLRLFRHGAGRCETRLYDQHFQVSGRTARLCHPMIDYHGNSLAEWSRRHIRWATAEVQELASATRAGLIAPNLAGLPTERKRALRNVYYKLPILLRPFLFFVYRYVFCLGFLDGREGLIFFVLQTFWFRFLVDATLYEMRCERGAPPRHAPER